MGLVVYFKYPFKNKYRTVIHQGKYVSVKRLASMVEIDEEKIREVCDFVEYINMQTIKGVRQVAAIDVKVRAFAHLCV